MKTGSELLLNRVRRMAEVLVNRYPTLFSTNFEKNKQALEEVAIIHVRALRNQLAGAITKIVKANAVEVAVPQGETVGAQPENDSSATSDAKKISSDSLQTEAPTASPEKAPDEGSTEA